LVTIEGTVEEIIFSNEANGYTVCEIKCDKEVITVVGYMPFINVGETLRVSGKWVIHPGNAGGYRKVSCVRAYQGSRPCNRKKDCKEIRRPNSSYYKSSPAEACRDKRYYHGKGFENRTGL